MRKPEHPRRILNVVYSRIRSAHADSKWLAVILALQMILSIIYLLQTPYGAPPDEPAHGLYVQELVESHALPVFNPLDRVSYETHQPPLYYLLGVPFFLAGRAADLDDPALAVRLLSVILGVLSVATAYRAIRIGFPDDRRLAIACAGFIVLLPTHVMVSSAVSNDILVELLFGLMLVFATRMLINGPDTRGSIAIGTVIGAGLLTKTTCILLLPSVFLVYMLMSRRNPENRGSILRHTVLALSIGLAVGGWWFVRNKLLYGDVLAAQYFLRAFSDQPGPAGFLANGWTWPRYLYMVVETTTVSFWGLLGHMNIPLPLLVYQILMPVTIIVMLASIWGVLRLRSRSALSGDVLLMYTGALLLVVLGFFRFNLTWLQAQGRYLYPALLPISVLWVSGVGALLPARIRGIAPCIAVGIPFLVQIIALATAVQVLPDYYNLRILPY